MSMKRFVRLSNGFSKKVANHECVIGLLYMFYNFGQQIAARNASDGRGDCGSRLDAGGDCEAG
jgi:hypothetical protein